MVMKENNSARVLIVEDEAHIRSGLRDVLVKNGYRVEEAESGEEALPWLRLHRFEAAIVDIRLPGMSGIDLLRSVRSLRADLSVIILTGHGTLDSAIAAVRAGAYDYLLKPALPKDILLVVSQAVTVCQRKREEARTLEVIRESLRRLEDLDENGEVPLPQSLGSRNLHLGRIFIDLTAHEVIKDHQPVYLTPSEFNLLVTLASRIGEAVEYAQLVEMVLGYQAELWEAKELIKRHVFTLRQKIEDDPASPDFILNVRGVGYRLVPA
jgi:DNA-binding response OmpR family regulator